MIFRHTIFHVQFHEHRRHFHVSSMTTHDASAVIHLKHVYLVETYSVRITDHLGYDP